MAGYTLRDGITVKNKLGATSHEELEYRQIEPVRYRLFQLEAGQGPKGAFDAKHLKAIHHHLFQDVFEWAGHTRNESVQLSDGSIATEPVLRKTYGRPFAEGTEIEKQLKLVDHKIRSGWGVKHLPREAFALRAADLMTDLNNIHPFREGNGRTQRTFMREMAREAAGHALDFGVVSKERMIQASIAGHEHNDRTMMQRMFVEISDPQRTAALRTAIAFFESEKFPWNDHYLATTEPGQKLDVVYAGRSGDHFMARTDSQILIGHADDLPQPQPARGERFTLTTGGAEPKRGQLAGRENDSGRDEEGRD